MAEIKKLLVLRGELGDSVPLPVDASTKVGLDYLVKAHNELGEVLNLPIIDGVIVEIEEIEEALGLNFYD